MSGRAAAPLRFDGKLKSWNDQRGFGFIEPARGGQDIFVHIKALPAGTSRPALGLRVSFEIEIGQQGKKRAMRVQFARTDRQTSIAQLEPAARWTLLQILVIPCFALTYLLVATQWSVTPVVALGYIGMSLTTFLAYALDKSAAIQGRWRISESTLHFLGLLCGWPGALLAQQFLRHKSSKRVFVTKYWMTVAANISVFVAASSPVLRWGSL